MVRKVFAVYDSKSQLYGQPFFVRTIQEALRSWSDICNDPETTFYKHPGDYTLFHLGEFNEETGRMENLETPYTLGLAQEQLRQKTVSPLKNSELGDQK